LQVESELHVGQFGAQQLECAHNLVARGSADGVGEPDPDDVDRGEAAGDREQRLRGDLAVEGADQRGGDPPVKVTAEFAATTLATSASVSSMVQPALA
jgi:hypothetical protein